MPNEDERPDEDRAEKLSSMRGPAVLALAGLGCGRHCEAIGQEETLGQAVSRALDGHYISRASPGLDELWIADGEGFEVGAYSGLGALVLDLCSNA